MFDSNSPNHPPDLIKCFFEYVHQQGALMRVLDALTQRISYVYNEEGCWFPDPDDPDPYFHFEGVKFGLVDESAIVVISEAECWQYVRQVAKVYAAECETNAVAVARMLARIVG
ncbi:ribonuclease toxin immunity protein CdiI [Variovorax sp. GB1P17]|uniref:ribonuclease toxin immunity protein CdiI n=1 Tax=Variovorax sp. GB1P17 TaxID=3443740 RepID=UPI003F48AFF4